MSIYDGILIPGGGLLEDGSLPPWTITRLERALSLKNESRWYCLLSGGTVHKPPPLTSEGFPIFESRQAAEYIVNAGIDPARVLAETCSYDTIGNAYFSRLLFTGPLELSRLHIITSDFHLPRTAAIFRWIYSLAPLECGYQLTFEGIPAQGLSPEAFQARQRREERSLSELQPKIQTISTLEVFHHWLYSEHEAYTVNQQREHLSDKELESY